MKRSSLKELLIFILWILVASFGYFVLEKYCGVTAEKIFYLIVAVIFELYIFFQLPGAKYFWNATEHAEDPIHRRIRLAVMSSVIALLMFVFKWAYFSELYFIATIRVDGIINFFRVPHEERHRILEEEGIPELKSYLYILVAAPIILALIGAAFFWFLFNMPAKSAAKKIRTVSYCQVQDFASSPSVEIVSF